MKKTVLPKKILISLLFLFSLINVNSNAQVKDINESFNKYTDSFEEVVYTHINKSTFIKGEKIGFTSYVLNKKSKKPSEITTNLYCIITDNNDNVIKRKLLRVIQGTTSNIFEIDSTFSGGDYKFKTYTNWMLNFKQQNFDVQSIKIIDPEKQTNYIKDKIATEIDAQFLPEGGHILNDVINTIGVIIKDEKGMGIANISGNVIDENENIITSFSVNKLGIGRFSLLAKSNKNYKIEIQHNNKIKTFYFNDKIENRGVNLKISDIGNEIIISLVTNNETLNQLKNKTYTLVTQNGVKIKTKEFLFNDKNVLSSIIRLSNLPTGINIFTLFNEKNQPVSERLFFNYHGLKINTNSVTSAVKKGDSVTLNLNYKDLLNSNFNNISVSILPSNTKSYLKNSILISQSLIQPYIKGTIENAGYYFNAIDKEKKYALDNLLITQGWSSYNWDEIFNYKLNSFKYNFEQGISLKINTTDKKESLYLIHGLKTKDPEYVTLKEGENTFKSLNFFPLENEKLHISKVNSNGKLYEPSLYVQYFPRQLPNLIKDEFILKPKQETYSIEAYNNKEIVYSNINKVQTLDPIIIEANLEKVRMEKITNKAMGAKVVFLETDRYNNLTLATFLSLRGLRAIDDFDTASLQVSFPASSFNAGPPMFYLNDMPINDPSYFYQYTMEIVDYVIINRDGFGEGMRGAGGVIRIYTDPLKNKNGKNSIKSIRKFDFPLTFSKTKKFYVPEYSDYSSSFFQKFGVIDWLPSNTIDKNGNVSLKFENKQNNNIKLFIEGITSDGEFIYEEKLISLE